MIRNQNPRSTGIAWLLFVCLALASTSSAQRAPLALQKIPNSKQYNIIFILLDDQRYDALGFLGSQPFIKTPNMDAVAKNGAYLPNAYVTTALCSPSRASILTGQYAHRHKVVDNDSPLPPGLTFFPQYLQRP